MTGKIEVKGGKGSAPALASKGSEPKSDLPEVKGVHGAQPAEFTMDGNVKVFHFTVDRISWETKEGKMVEAWAFNRQVPGPTIRAKEGERVRIVVTNNLPEGTSAHWHGLEVPNNMDGVPGISQDPIAPGESFTYEFTAKPSGTHLYHSHFNSLHQEEHGLYGMFIVDPKVERATMKADREEIMIIGDGPLGFVINGKEFPMIEPIKVQKGERIRVRMANLGGLYHPMHLHGGHFTVVAKDGFPVPAPQDMNTLSIAPGETFDVILKAEEPGVWLWHCHVLSHVTGPKDENGIPTVAGMVGVVQVEDGKMALPDMKNHKNH
jgi:FtsP/CotA-like multicopper oxidase with cupredoxin domain